MSIEISKSLTFLLLISPQTADSEVNQGFRSSFQLEAKSFSFLDSDTAEPQGDVVADFPHAVVPVDVLENVEGDVLCDVVFKS